MILADTSAWVEFDRETGSPVDRRLTHLVGQLITGSVVPRFLRDELGSSVAVSGDTLVVGAPEEDSSATGIGGSQTSNSNGDSGAAYVFR